MSDNSNPRLEKLTSDNFMVWSTRMEDHQVCKDLLGAIIPEFLSTNPTVEQIKADRKAFALLRTYVSDSLIHFLNASMTASELGLSYLS
jgi:hypothetical protein